MMHGTRATIQASPSRWTLDRLACILEICIETLEPASRRGDDGVISRNLFRADVSDPSNTTRSRLHDRPGILGLSKHPRGVQLVDSEAVPPS